MRHVSLYRKWRPRTFDAIVGQEPVVRTLRRAIETGRVAHAYLFSGPRGTGKTSTAKVLAMGLNCEKGPTPEPDGTCESCRAIINNSSMDVLEMDAASNRGIDEIRDLRDRVNLAAAGGRMKVYIIDEVHMLTTEAFNALLKMLEEPPEHVVFVLATTEKHKVLPTIISRCQSFDFRRPGVATLSEKLREIADAEGIEVEPGALTILAREGRGSFRDAEGLLDQLSSFADGPVTVEKVRELLGSVGSETLLETVYALYERRAADALRVVDRLQNEGRDPSRFVSELIAHLRRLMLLANAPEIALSEVGEEERAALEEQADRVPTREVVREIEALGDALPRMGRGDPKLELELAFLKLARDYAEPQADALLGRLEALERAVANGAAPGSVSTAERDAAPAAKAPDQSSRGAEEAPGDGAGEETERSGPASRPEGSGHDEARSADGGLFLADRWDAVIQDLRDRRKALTAAYLKEGQTRPVGYEDGVLTVAFAQEQDFYVREIDKPQHREALEDVLEARLGARPRLEFLVTGEDGAETPAGAPVGAGANGETRPAGAESPRREEPEIAAPVPEAREATPEPVAPPELGEAPPEHASKEDEGGMIQTELEVFEMARERFGPRGTDL